MEQNTGRKRKLELESDEECEVLRKEKADLLNESKNLTETLRRLKLVKFYDEKHNVAELKEKTEAWLKGCQRICEELLSIHPEPRPPMEAFLQLLGVEPQMIRYNTDEEEFY